MNPDPYTRPEVATYEPTVVYTTAPVEPFVQPGPVVWVPDAYGRLVPMPKHLAPAPMQAMPPRDLTPQPLFDPRAQILVGGGVFAAGTGWGVGQVLSSLAAVGSGVFMWLAIALIAAKFSGSVSGGGGDTTITTTVNNHNKWWGRSNTNV